MDIITTNTEQTQDLARHLGQIAPAGTVLLLHGQLGAGKTSFVQGLAVGLAITDNVNSPTYTIIRSYQGRLSLHHFDLYRLTDAEELWDLGLEEYLAAGAVVAIEWPQLALEHLPEQHLAIFLEHQGDDRRKIRLAPRGAVHSQLAEELMHYADPGT